MSRIEEVTKLMHMLIERNKDNEFCEMTTAEYRLLCLPNEPCDPYDTEAMHVMTDGGKRIKITDLYRGKITNI